MIRSRSKSGRRVLGAAIASLACASVMHTAHASDHLDTPTVKTNPRADIGDLYAWISPDARRLNLVMTVVGPGLSENIWYAFHVDSGKQFGSTTTTSSIVCQVLFAKEVACHAGDDDVLGDASASEGLPSHRGRFRVFAGPRDDPFFNNVRGTRAAYEVAAAALRGGTAADAAGCPSFDRATARTILSTWRQTDGGPATNFLAGWTPAALVVSIDLELVNRGGPLLAVWATTTSDYGQIDRMGRPLTGNALLATLASADVSDKLKEQYNRATPSTAGAFVGEIEQSLGLYDGFDGRCGDQFLADEKATGKARYRALATLLADDRLWVNSEASTCTQLFAVERAHLSHQRELAGDCGGRSPTYSAVNAYRSLLVDGTTGSVDDGLSRDELEHSSAVFPFLAAPARDSSYKE